MIDKENISSREKKFIQYNATGTKVIGTFKQTKEEQIQSKKTMYKMMYKFKDITQDEYEELMKKLDESTQ